MKTYSAKAGEVGRTWFVIDATDQVLGRLATRIATVLRGKHKPPYTPHIDTGDFVIVTNAGKVRLTGNKIDQKQFRRHSGYPGGLSSVSYREVLDKHPERVIEQAVFGMLPKGRLGRQLRRKLKVYRGAEHPHASQKPQALDVDGPIPVHTAPEPKPKPRTKTKQSAPKRKSEKGADTQKAKPPSKPSRRKSTGKSAPSSKTPKNPTTSQTEES